MPKRKPVADTSNLNQLDAYPNLRNRYSANDGNNIVYYLKDAVATFSSFKGDERVVKF